MKALPKDGFAGLKENGLNDLTSGFLVFLIALPLCLGISMASGFPPIAGIFTAIIGGLVVSPIMGSRVSIKGPAAGLIAIAVAAVADLGQGDAYTGYRLALAVVVATGIIQVLFATFKFGRFVDFFPTSAVHGMLAAIGIIIILKQFPVMLGVKPTAKSPLGLLLELPSILRHANPEISAIGLLSLAVLIAFPFLKHPLLKKLPAQMVVLLLAMALGAYFDLEHTHHYQFLHDDFVIGPDFLVTLPNNMLDGVTLPDFSQVFSATSLKYILMFSLVGSLESLLTVKAVDGLDPYKRKSDTNRDLLAVGLGNTLAGLVGGLPMIAEVVRSGANVNNGAKTRWSNFFHGAFLLAFVAIVPGILHLIPLSGLAAMLVFTGYRLASPALFKATAKVGRDQLAIFLITIAVTLGEDLLLGIAAGIVLQLILHLASGAKLSSLFKPQVEIQETGDSVKVILRSTAAFTNILGLQKALKTVPKGKKVDIDLSEIHLIDHSFMELLHDYEHDYQRSGGQVQITGQEALTSKSEHPLATKRRPKNA